VAGARTRLAVALFPVAFGTNVATPLLLVYDDRLGLSDWTLTALFAVYPLGLAPALVLSGPASDVLGRRAVMVPGIVLSGLSSAVLIAGADHLWMLYLGRFLLGVVSGLVFVVASAWMAEHGRDAPLWTARMLALVMYGGFGLGPLVAGIAGQWLPAPLLGPYLAHIAMVAVAMVVVFTVPETVTRDRTRRIRPNLGIPEGRHRAFWTVVVPTGLGVFGMPSLAFGLFPVLLKPAMPGVAVFVSGMLGMLAMGSIVPAQAVIGRVGPHRGAPLALASGTVGCVLGLIAFGTDTWPLLFIAAVFMGAASGMAMTSGLRFVDLLCRAEDRGALTGAFYAVAYAGMMMPVVVTSIAAVVGSTAVVLGAVALTAASLAYVLRRTTAYLATT